MVEAKNPAITVRVSQQELQLIKEMVSKGKYLNPADFARTGIRKLLDEELDAKSKLIYELKNDFSLLEEVLNELKRNDRTKELILEIIGGG